MHARPDDAGPRPVSTKPAGRRAAALAVLIAGALTLSGCGQINDLISKASGGGGSTPGGGTGTTEPASGGTDSGGTDSGSGGSDSGSGGAQSGELGDVHSDPSGFTIKPPAGWEEAPGALSGSDKVVFYNPDHVDATEDYYDVTVAVTVEPAGGDTLEEIAGGYTTDEDSEIVLNEPLTLSDGTEAYVVSSIYTGPDGLKQQSVQVMAVTANGSELVEASGVAITDVWGDYEAALDASARSLTLEG